MKVYISSFGNLRYFTPNIIPISTAQGWPYWLYKSAGHQLGEYYVDKNGVMIGISEEAMAFPKDEFEKLTEPCQKNCPYKDKAPNCQFMLGYHNHLKSLDFKGIIEGFERAAEDVRKITHYEGEPVIVLLVYEAPSCPCAERPCIRRWFDDNGYELPEWDKTLLDEGLVF